MKLECFTKKGVGTTVNIIIYIRNSFMSMSKGKEVAKFVCCIVSVVKFLFNCQTSEKKFQDALAIIIILAKIWF